MPLLRLVQVSLGGVAHVHLGVEVVGSTWDNITKVVEVVMGDLTVEVGEGIEVVEVVVVVVVMGMCLQGILATGIKVIR